MQGSRFYKIGVGLVAMLVVVAAAVWVVAPDRAASTQPARDQAGRALSVGSAMQGITPGGSAELAAFDNQVVVILPDKVDESPPLRDIPPIEPVPAAETLLRWNETALRTGVGSFDGVDVGLQTESGILAMPTPIANFAGTGNVNGVLPPDTQGDVGPNHYVQWVNLAYSIYDKSGTRLAGPTNGNTLWSGFDTDCANNNDGDPITIYDYLADRWFMSQFQVNSGASSYQCIAVSTTPDPTGPWYRYKYTWPNTLMNDYPHFGLWPDAYYMTANQFVYSTGAWRGAGVAAFERDKMLTGATAQMVYFSLYTLDADYGGQLPADMDGTTQPAAGAPGLILEWDDSTWGTGSTDSLKIWQFHVDWTTPGNSYLGTGSAGSAGGPNWTINTNDVDPTICGSSYCIDQPGTTVNLDQLADRLMHRVQYRNFGGYQTLVGNHTVDTNDPSGIAGIHWFELRNSGTDWAMYQQGTYGLADSVGRWMGSIAMDDSGNMALGFSASSGSLYPSIRYVGRLASDPLGTMGQSETTLIAGSGYQSSSYSRWGDYSAMQIDPSDGCTFWFTTEYIATSGSANWVTRIGAFKLDQCGTGFTLDASPGVLDVCAPDNAIYTVSLGSLSGFDNPVTLTSTGHPDGTTATFAPNPVTPPGDSVLTVAGTGAAAPGSYQITIGGSAQDSPAHQTTVGLNLSAALPAVTTLLLPSDGAAGVALTPVFGWTDLPNEMAYTLEIATDPAFVTIVHSAPLAAGTTSYNGATLSSATVYYWRVRAANACGSRDSATQAFVTVASSCLTYTSTDVPKNITDGATVNSTLIVADTFNATDVNVTIGQILHTCDGDLDISIVHPDATALNLSSDNGGSGDNYVNTVFDDEASTRITMGTAPFTGSYRPETSLTGLDGDPVNGTWRLRIYDDATGDTGTLNSWSMTLCGAPVLAAADYSDLAGSYGVAWHTGDGSLRLGSAWSADTDFDAGTDDSDDGVTFTTWVPGASNDVQVSVQGNATNGRWLRLWFDWDLDGVFDDDGGELVWDGAVSDGNNLIPVSVPAGLNQPVNYRARLYDSDGTTTGLLALDLNSAGGATGGEVEDNPQGTPTAVSLTRFEALPAGPTIRVQWETVAELDNLGFNLYRSTTVDGQYQRLNDTLIPSQAPGASHRTAYAWTDGDVLPGQTYFYNLEAVDVHGRVTPYGWVSTTAAHAAYLPLLLR